MEATAWEGQDVASYAGSVEGVDSSAVVALAEVMSELEASIWSGDGAVLERHGIQSAADEAMGGGL
jgi:hypothetical protein